jgi:hypothetical protein
MRYYRPISLIMAVTFALTGLLFLFFANGVLVFFNQVARLTGLKFSPVAGVDFYLILAAAYMYLVTLLAVMMFRHPGNYWFPLLLTNTKFASSLLSFSFFILHQPYPVYLTNALVDGLIGALVLYFYRQVKKGQP